MHRNIPLIISILLMSHFIDGHSQPMTNKSMEIFLGNVSSYLVIVDSRSSDNECNKKPLPTDDNFLNAIAADIRKIEKSNSPTNEEFRSLLRQMLNGKLQSGKSVKDHSYDSLKSLAKSSSLTSAGSDHCDVLVQMAENAKQNARNALNASMGK
jgi:hypothetical protein